MIEKLCQQYFESGAQQALSDFGLVGGTKTAGWRTGGGNLDEGLKGIRKAFATVNGDPHMTDLLMPDLERHLAAVARKGDPAELAAARGELDRLHALHGTPPPAPVVVPPTPVPAPAPSRGLDRVRDIVRNSPLAVAGGLGAAGLGAGALGGYAAAPEDGILDHLKFWE